MLLLGFIVAVGLMIVYAAIVVLHGIHFRRSHLPDTKERREILLRAELQGNSVDQLP